MPEIVDPTSLAGSRRARLNSLTGLRWWAAFGVFAHHMGNFAPLPAASFLRIGAEGVTFFFVLSGFVLTWSADRNVSTTTFWWRRFARIWPAHMVALLVAVPIFYDASPDPAQWWVKPLSFGILILSVPLLQGWSTNPTILYSGNPAAWTLSCEAFFYTLHPGIHMAFRKFGRGAAITAVFSLPVLGAALWLALSYVPSLARTPQPLLRLWEFMLGMALARAIQCGWKPRLPFWLAVAVLTLAAFAIWRGPVLAPNLWLALHADSLEPVVIGTLSGIVILAGALRDIRGERSWASSRLMVYLGELSYAFYLVHATVVYAFVTVLGGQATSWTNLLWYGVLLLFSLAAAVALHHWVEKPFERRIRRWRELHDQRRRHIAPGSSREDALRKSAGNGAVVAPAGGEGSLDTLIDSPAPSPRWPNRG